MSSSITTKTSLNELTVSEINDEVAVEEIDEAVLAELHPQLADVIKTIQAEKFGDKEIAWSDFSQHTKGSK